MGAAVIVIETSSNSFANQSFEMSLHRERNAITRCRFQESSFVDNRVVLGPILMALGIVFSGGYPIDIDNVIQENDEFFGRKDKVFNFAIRPSRFVVTRHPGFPSAPIISV